MDDLEEKEREGENKREVKDVLFGIVIVTALICTTVLMLTFFAQNNAGLGLISFGAFILLCGVSLVSESKLGLFPVVIGMAACMFGLLVHFGKIW